MSFALFPLLPTELRLEIWRYCLPPPRIIPINYNTSHSCYTSTLPPRATFSVCSESRRVTLPYYSLLCFGTGPPSSIYMDYSVDTLYIAGSKCWDAFKEDVATSEDIRWKVKNFAVDLMIEHTSWIRTIWTMRGLKKTYIVVKLGQARCIAQKTVEQELGLKLFKRMERCIRSTAQSNIKYIMKDEDRKDWSCPEVRCVTMVRGGVDLSGIEDTGDWDYQGHRGLIVFRGL